MCAMARTDRPMTDRPMAVTRFANAEELRRVDHAAIEADMTRSDFLAAAALEKAEAVLKQVPKRKTA